ncbi:MAG: Stp1/IreP family PP2C-type Ser/Thr phosphatase [Gemmatimonadota bacterium]|nr:MAG: Stp1/IreP family PP2C-type Ser/Thr phosphatase [Gemmatimonadota bacterium]
MNIFRRKAPRTRISVFGKTDVGMNRTHNEDSFLVADLTAQKASLLPEVRLHEIGPKGSLLMVADGMGGAAAGEVASEMATQVIYQHLLSRWIPDKESSPRQFAFRLREAVEEANSKIHAYAKEHPENRGMGTTVTAVGVLIDHIYLTQVGDSRAYLIRNGTAIQLTKDQSLMQRLVDAGELTEEEAERSERKNIILQALGPEGRVRVDLTHQKISRGDAILLCSDGLSGPVSKEELARVVSENEDLVKASSELIALANERGGPDNITVIVAKFTGDALQEPTDDETVGYEIFALPDTDEATHEVPIVRDSSPPTPSRSSLIAAGATAAAVVIGALAIAVL